MRFKNIDFKKNFSDALKFTVVISMIYFFVNFKYPYTLTYFLQDAWNFLLILISVFLVNVLFDGIMNWFKNR